MATSPSLTHLLPPTPSPPTQATRLLTPTTQPIPLLSTPRWSRTYSYLHTTLVLGYLFLRFGTLVAQPLDTLVYDLIPLALLQCVFCGVCLPPAGTWTNVTPGTAGAGMPLIQGTAMGGESRRKGGGGGGAVSSSGGGSGRKRPAGLGKSGSGGSGMFTSVSATSVLKARIMPTLFSLILAITLPPIPLTVLALVLGAPLWPYSLLPHTGLLSMHVSLLAFFPLFYTHGVSSAAWRDVLAAWLPFDEAGVWGGTVGTLVGGWIGAVPIALDWDRDWQAWPVTVVVGAYAGWAVGRIVTGSLQLGVGKRINLSESEHADYTTVAEDVDLKKKKTT